MRGGRKGETYRIAFSSLGAQAAAFHVELAVVRRGDEIHEVQFAVGLGAEILGQQHPAPVLPPLPHLVRHVELLLQHRADLNKKNIVNFAFAQC